MGIADWSQTRREAQPFVHKGVRMGMSGAQILRSLQDVNMGYREGDFYADWRMYNDYRLNEARIARLKPDTPIPDGWKIESPMNHTQRYRYDFKTSFIDQTTGELTEGFKSFSSDKWMTKGEAEDYIENDVPWEISEPESQFQGGQLIGVLHRQGDVFP